MIYFLYRSLKDSLFVLENETISLAHYNKAFLINVRYVMRNFLSTDTFYDYLLLSNVARPLGQIDTSSFFKQVERESSNRESLAFFVFSSIWPRQPAAAASIFRPYCSFPSSR